MDLDVLIVGAGPVGLFLGARLRACGHAVRIVEAHTGQSVHSKALAIIPRTLECLRIAGLAAPFEAAAHRVRGAQVFLDRAPAGTISLAPKESRYDYVAMVPQDVTERILLDAYRAAGGSLDYETRLTSLVDGEDGVTARLHTPRGEERVTARYVVGCDGAHSSVRDLIGFGFAGEAYGDTFVLADVDAIGDVAAEDLLICIGAAGPLAMFPITPKRLRIIATVAPGDDTELTLDAVNALIGERGPWNIGATNLHWASRFHIARRLAPGMQKGAVFLAGDAAHVHSPVGGQGMNTGLQDAFNLAWKLDYSLRGFATKALLESYTLERHPVAQQVIRATDIGTRIAVEHNALLRAVRAWALPRALAQRAVQTRILATLSGLGVRYEGSPIVAGSGRRAPDTLVRDGERERRLYDMLGDRYRIVYPASVPHAVTVALETFVQHYAGAVSAVSSDGAGLPLVRLVRPDGYVALETALATDPTGPIEKLTAVLGSHLRRASRAA